MSGNPERNRGQTRRKCFGNPERNRGQFGRKRPRIRREAEGNSGGNAPGIWKEAESKPGGSVPESGKKQKANQEEMLRKSGEKQKANQEEAPLGTRKEAESRKVEISGKKKDGSETEKHMEGQGKLGAAASVRPGFGRLYYLQLHTHERGPCDSF